MNVIRSTSECDVSGIAQFSASPVTTDTPPSGTPHQPGELKRCAGHLLRRLEDHGATGDECRTELGRGQKHLRVPRHDHDHNARTPLRLALLPAAETALLLPPSPTADAAEYDIDHAHSFIQFRVSHLGLSWLLGRFDQVSGSFAYDPDGGEQTQSTNVLIDVGSLNSNHAERDRHLLSDDFLDAANHSEASFTSTSFSGDASGGTLSGDLNLHGGTRPTQLTVRLIGEGDDPWGGYRAGFEGTTRIKASDYGIDHRAVDMVDISLFVKRIRR